MNDSITNRRGFMKVSAAGAASFATILAADHSAGAVPAVSAAGLSPLHEHLRASVLEFAAAMPEEQFGFKPTPEIESYAGQLLHIAASNYRLGSIIKEEKSPDIDLKAEGKSKKEIMDAIDKSFAYSAQVLSGLDDAEAGKEVTLFGNNKVSKYLVALLLRNHISHHRGQCVIYLRLKGIKPPQYRGL